MNKQFTIWYIIGKCRVPILGREIDLLKGVPDTHFIAHRPIDQYGKQKLHSRIWVISELRTGLFVYQGFSKMSLSDAIDQAQLKFIAKTPKGTSIASHLKRLIQARLRNYSQSEFLLRRDNIY